MSTPPPVFVKTDPRQRVGAPGALMVAFGVFWLLLGLACLVMALFFAGALALAAQDAGDEAAEVASFLTGGFGVVVSALAVVLAAATILAGVRMRNLRSRWLAILASLVMMLPFFSPCCFLGIPIGIWCLIVLSDRDVKAAFH